MSDDNCKFFLKRTTNRSVRTRLTKTSSSNSSDSDSDEESSVIISDRKKRKPNPMIQSTCSFRKSLKNKNKKISHEDSDDDDDDNDAIHVSYASSKSGQRDGPSDMGATMTLETETERDKDAQSIFERSRKIQEETMDPNNDEQIYRGANNYQQYKQKKDTPFGNASSGHVRKGPMRAPDNIRSTVRWDYQPDICKDYKETGFCGFGDSCKFLHDRSDYKAGWQLELETSTKGQKHKHGHENEDDDNDDDPDKYKIDDDDDLPFACFICRNRFVNPVATKCKHYFCQQCALDHYKKSTKCFVCGAQTSGVFNIAKDIEKRMKTSEQFEQQKDESDEKDSEPDDQQDGQPSNDDDDDDNENI
uniref:E3 ubiquitin-protein ligase RNF113A-like n=1 Tax=Dermatophagoides pteronyssinus TaxID=6956 RepID=A0A6P6XPL2_DERPT|nr:E3 ubiquitin-protein ligase RNF113A-like [Dermatophagoides pteronyssinus]